MGWRRVMLVWMGIVSGLRALNFKTGSLNAQGDPALCGISMLI